MLGIDEGAEPDVELAVSPEREGLTGLHFARHKARDLPRRIGSFPVAIRALGQSLGPCRARPRESIMKKEIKPYRPVYPSPAALITSADSKGGANIITLGEVFNISVRDPVILGIAVRPATYSHGLISETREFVINLPTVKILEKVDRCGVVSGRTCPDKFPRNRAYAHPFREGEAARHRGMSRKYRMRGDGYPENRRS